MLDSFFLSYASYSFSEDLENIRKIFKEIIPHVYVRDVNEIAPAEILINELVNLIIFFVNDIPNKQEPPPRPHNGIYSRSFYESVKDNPYYDYNGSIIHRPLIPMALHAVYGPSFKKVDDCRDCIYGRFLNIPAEEIQKKKCFECAQHAFKKQMTDIVEGTEFKNFISFGAGRYISSYLDLLLELSHEYFYTRLSITDGKVKNDMFIDVSKFIYPSIDEKDLGKRFNDFLFSLAGYSLSNFLINTDRRKLKQCPFCHIFFIAKDTKRKVCYSNACEKIYRRLQKQEQRRRDPVKYL